MAPSRDSSAPANALKEVKNIVASIGFDVLIGAVSSFTLALTKSILSAQKLQEALKASAGAETLKQQFIALGSTAAAAEARIASLARIAANGAVSFESLGNASKILRVLGGAAADTEANIKRIADVFAASGAPVAAVATAYANFYKSVKEGGDVGSAAQEMANLGGISQDTAAKLKQLESSGAPVGTMLRTMTDALDSARGASAALKDTINGLQAQLKNLEESNNIKLGDKFAEGEKAGLRAAIAFEKLKNILQNGIANVIAPIKGAFASLTETIVSSGSATAAVKALTLAIQGLVLIAIGSLISAAAQGVAGILSLAPALLKVGQAVLSTASVLGAFKVGSEVVFTVLKGGLAILSSAAAGWTVFGTAIAKAGLDSFTAVQNINKLNQEAQKSTAAKASQVNQNRKDIATLNGPEDQDKKIDEIDAQINDVEEQKKIAQDKIDAAKASQKKHEAGYLFTNDFKFAPAARAEDQANLEAGQGELNRLNGQSSLLQRQREQTINKTGLGVDREEDQRLRQQAVVERQIRDQGVQVLQSSLSPERALQVGQSELERLQGQYEQATVESSKTYNDRRQINRLDKNLVDAKSSEEYGTALNQLTDFNPTTQASNLDKEVTLRTSLREERARQQQASDEAFNFSGPAERKNGESQQQADARRNTEAAAARKDAQDKLAKVNSVIQSRYGGNESEISSATTQGLSRQRDDILKKMDSATLSQQIASQADQVQQQKVSVAAKDSSIEKEKERVNLETQLASLSNTSANAEFKAGAASSQRVEQLKKAKQASEELDKKTSEYISSKRTPEEASKKQELESAQVNAAKAGVEGRSTGEINQELNAEKQILEVKLSAARIAENAAKAEYEASQRRLEVEKQMVELRAAQAEQLNGGGYGGKGEGEIRGESQDKEIEKQQAAVKAAQARDAAESAAKAAPTEENKAAARNAAESAAALGVTPDTNTRDVEAKLQDAKQKRADTAVGEATGNNAAELDLKIQAARVQERFAPSGSAALSAKQQADFLEDQKAKADKVKELTSGPNPIKGDVAERIADIDVQRNRIIKNIDQEGKPEASSMARIGGSSGFAGVIGGATQDKQAKLEQLNSEMLGALRSLDANTAQAMSFYRSLLNKNQ
jgi:colicin import membrane protein